jgi:lipopolysaccharide biosynthesis glycosyltransferase
MRIALVCDAAYAPWAGTSIKSCLASNPERIMRFDVLHDGSLNGADQDRFQEMVRNSSSDVQFHTVGRNRLEGIPFTEQFGPIVWLRFLLPELLADAERVLYLDADTLVTGGLDGLFDMALGDSALAAVPNVVEPAARSHVSDLGLHYPGGYANSGVLLLDLELMRKEGSTDQLLRYAVDNRAKLLWPDQDALNVVFADRWTRLHPRWNAQNSLWSWSEWAAEVFDEATVREAIAEPSIRHFEGPSLSKPWHYLCPHPWRDQYRTMLASTPWAGTPLEDRTIGTLLIRRLPSRLRLGVYRALVRWRARRG